MAIGFRDRLVADALRRHELATATPPGRAAEALAAGRIAAGDVEAKIIARARATEEGAALARDFARAERFLRYLVLLAGLIALFAGAATARTAFAATPEGIVNIYWVLGSLLAIHLVTLIIWLASAAITPRGGGGVIGESLLWLWRTLAARLGSGTRMAAAVEAEAAALGTPGLGRWTLSSLTHLIWTLYLVGALLMVLALLSARHYAFVWQTTILAPTAYLDLTRALAALPQLLGFTAPDTAMIIAAEWPGATDSAAARHAWSGFLIGVIVVYGIAPRLIALAFSVALAARGRRRYRLDLAQPEFARLAAQLVPAHGATVVVDPDDGAAEERVAAEWIEEPLPAARGATALVGLEIDPPATGWPPGGGDTLDLGIADGRDAVEAALAQLDSVSGLGRLIVVLDAAVTPDRGMVARLARIANRVSAPIVSVLTGEARLMRRLGEADQVQRLADWRAAVERAGLRPGWMRRIDLDQEAGARAWMALVKGGDR